MTQSNQSAVERYFEVALYLLMVTGFATLASTGKLDALSVAFVGAALLYRGYLLVRRQVFLLTERWTTYLTMAYVLFYLADFFLLSGSFVTATVHLVLFAMMVKIFSVQRDRDHLYLAILSFAMVLGAALWTVDSIFLMAFSAFMLLAVATFISMEMKRSAAAAASRARELRDSSRRLASSLSTTAFVLMLAIVVGAAVIFFVLPRLSAGYLSAYAPRSDLVSGFSDDVRLGDIGEIKQSNSVVMHIEIEGDTRGAFDLKWRGIALGNFDGERWTNPAHQVVLPSAADGGFDLLAAQARLQPAGEAPARNQPFRFLRYRVVMEPIGTNVFFLAPRAQSLYGGYREVAVDATASVFNSDRDRMITSYRAVSNIQEPRPETLRRSAGDLPPRIAIEYLQLPAVDLRVRQLSEQITAPEPTAYDKAAALERYLKTRYGYTLQLPRSRQRDPLAYFLFERKAGHCEYFASAMAIMLRTLGIPSRVVNGFRTGEFNPVTGSYIIRAREAHSWVEAYFPGYGWAGFDPTPPDPKVAETPFTRFMLYLDALREFWREWVINYDFAHQTTLTNNLTVRSRRFFVGARLWLRQHYRALLQSARRTQAQAVSQPRRYGIMGVGAVLLLILLINARRLWRAWHSRRLAAHPERAPQAAASIWYGRMTRLVARHGFRKRPSQTPLEFVAAIDAPSLRRSVANFTAHYERARFGQSPEDARALPELYEEISRKN